MFAIVRLNDNSWLMDEKSGKRVQGVKLQNANETSQKEFNFLLEQRRKVDHKFSVHSKMESIENGTKPRARRGGSIN